MERTKFNEDQTEIQPVDIQTAIHKIRALKKSMDKRADEIESILKLLAGTIGQKEKWAKEKYSPIKNLKEKKEKEKKDKIFKLLPIISNSWDKLLQEWLEYKAERNELYQGTSGMRQFQTYLKKYSNNDLSIAREIIDRSMANNWSGIWPMDSRSSKQTHKPDKIMENGKWYFKGTNGKYYTKSGELLYD